VIYSVHNPYEGGFDYWEAGDRVPLNDDLPTPRYFAPLATPVGVPASMAGRPLPPDARKVGHGVLPVGSISSGEVGVWKGTKKTGVPSGIGAFAAPVGDRARFLAVGAVVAAVAALGAFAIMRSRQKERSVS
jgi:hypothetical protein